MEFIFPLIELMKYENVREINLLLNDMAFKTR